MAFLQPDDIINNAVFSVEDSSLWIFGTLSSRAFTAWVKAVSSRLESRIQIAAGPVYNTFPFIQPDGKDLEAVEAAAQGVLDARAAHPSSRLADLYDPLAMPKDLRDAHKALDKAILGLYGLKPEATESEIVAALIARYKELDSKDQLPLPASSTRKQPRAAATSPAQAPAIRAWATANGITVPSRGRIPREVLTAYNQAHGAPGDE